jgi:aerobic carbon-monoxide dehydrogenase medium subunit
MQTAIESFHRPTSVATAWELLRDGTTVRVLAGGTDLVTRCPPEVRTLVDLSGLGLRYVDAEPDGALRFGAMATFTDLLEHPGVARYAGGVLPEMLVHVGSLLHRNSATVGGHVARGRLSDVVPVLLALDAEVRWFDGEEQTEALEDYYAAARNRTPHLVLEVLVPTVHPGTAGAFERFSRVAFDHALVNVACRLDVTDGIVREARVVVGELASLGRALEPARQALVGAPPDPDRIAAAARAARDAADVSGDWLMTAEYRRHLVEVLVARCLTTAAERAGGDG